MIYLGNTPVGVAIGVGEFAQHKKVQATFPDAGDNNNYQVVSVGFAPKYAMFYGGTDKSGNMICGFFTINYNNEFPNIVGFVRYRNKASGNLIWQEFSGWNDGSSHGAITHSFYYYDGDFYISRVGGNGNFSTTDTYIFEFYA